MKPTELQIGDWVQSKIHNGKTLYTRIVALDNRDKEKHIISSNRWIEDYKFEPIPLTPEILEKNGFGKVYNEDVIIYRKIYEKKTIDIEVGINYKINEDGGFYLNRILHRLYYVHQLQHALRLCGLEELADSFKVESLM